jgi:hypothetical protein
MPITTRFNIYNHLQPFKMAITMYYNVLQSFTTAITINQL